MIISSATLDSSTFLDYFNTNADGTDRSLDDAIVVSLEGRMFPVEVVYLEEPTRDYVESAVRAVLEIHLKVSRSIVFP